MAVVKARRDTSAELALLEELKTAAAKLGLQVREERLLREVGYHARSGRCRVRDTEVIFLDRDQPASAHIEVLVDELAGRPLEHIYLSPAARALVERAAVTEVRQDGGDSPVGG